jgi:hypothetical protein
MGYDGIVLEDYMDISRKIILYEYFGMWDINWEYHGI